MSCIVNNLQECTRCLSKRELRSTLTWWQNQHFQHGSKAFNPPYLYHKIYNQPARQQHLHRFTTGTIDSSDELLATLTQESESGGASRRCRCENCEDFSQWTLVIWIIYIYICINIIYINIHIHYTIYTHQSSPKKTFVYSSVFIDVWAWKAFFNRIGRIGRLQCDVPSHGSPWANKIGNKSTNRWGFHEILWIAGRKKTAWMNEMLSICFFLGCVGVFGSVVLFFLLFNVVFWWYSGLFLDFPGSSWIMVNIQHHTTII